jgi:hypothetical protein
MKTNFRFALGAILRERITNRGAMGNLSLPTCAKDVSEQ